MISSKEDILISGTIFAISAGMIYWGFKTSNPQGTPNHKKTILLTLIGFGFFIWWAERFFSIHFFQTRDAHLYKKE